MAKITLGKTPKNFKRTITVDLIDGTKGAIEIVFKFRTRKEFGAFLDGIFKDTGVKPETAEEEKVLIEQIMSKACGTNANYLLQVIESWDLADDISIETLEQLCDEYPGVANAIMESYRLAVTEGKAKN